MSTGELITTVVLRTLILGGSVVLMIQGHDWNSELLSGMGLVGIVCYVVLTTDTSRERSP